VILKGTQQPTAYCMHIDLHRSKLLVAFEPHMRCGSFPAKTSSIADLILLGRVARVAWQTAYNLRKIRET
jgi:hypothetical protein